MQLLPILALLERRGASPFDDLLRLIGIAAIVWAFFKGLKSLLNRSAAPTTPAAAAPATAPAAAAPPAAGDELPPEIIAVIAAAVARVCGPARRVVSIRSHSSHWEMAGRQSVLTSHRIR